MYLSSMFVSISTQYSADIIEVKICLFAQFPVKHKFHLKLKPQGSQLKLELFAHFMYDIIKTS